MHLGFCSVVFLGLVYVASNVLGCSVLEPGARAFETGHEFETDDRKVYYTEVIVVGQIVRKVQGDYPFKGIKGVYTVEFKVDCTYKGGPVPETIFIAGIGNSKYQIKGCPAAKLSDKKAVMFLKPTEKRDVFEIEFSPYYSEEIWILLDDLIINCGLNLTDVRDDVCADFEPLTVDDGCIAWTPIRPLVTEKPTTKGTPKPELEPEVTRKPVTKPSVPETTGMTDDNDDVIGDDKIETNTGYKKETVKNVGLVTNENGSTIYKASFAVTLVTALFAIIV